MSSNIAVHHVELCKDPISLTPEDKQVFFDECNKELVCISSRGLSCTPLEGERRGLRVSYYSSSLNSVTRNRILNAKLSPDHSYVAVQSTPVDIDFTNLKDNATFSLSYKGNKAKGTILNFFWTFDDNFLVVLTGSLDLYHFPKASRSSSLKLLNTQKVNAGWYHYSSDTRHRILLTSPPLSADFILSHSSPQAVPPSPPATRYSLAHSTQSTPPASPHFHVTNATQSLPTAPQIPIFTFYFKHNKIVKMPRFDIDSDGVPLASQELVVHQLYDAIYCIRVNSHRKELVLYQLTKDMVIKKICLDLITSGPSYIHVVDNLLLVHNIMSRVTMMFDIKSRKDMGWFPVASPLPIFVPSEQATSSTVYSDSWTFHLPCYILDKGVGTCWDVGLNLDGIVQSLTNDRCRMTEFLLRRALPQTKKILLRELCAMVVEQESLAVTAQVFDLINGVLETLLRDRATEAHPSPVNSRSTEKTLEMDSEALNEEWTPEHVESIEAPDPDDISLPMIAPPLCAPTHSYTPPQAHASPSTPRGDSTIAVTQADMYAHVFMTIEAREPPLLDAKYLVGVLTEYIRSLNFHHLLVTPFLYELLINFLVSNKKWSQLHQFLQYHVVSDSTHVACQLLSLESKYPPAYQLALDMLKRLNTHEQIMEVLISKNMLMHALRFMKAHRVKIPSKRVIEAATQLQDDTVLFHVYRFFEARKELSQADCEKFKKLFGERKVRL
eukprot:Phypoly_transcript_03526.p1 GENE.Phypoly_transcript_03526~~Phypoly_transcript_03526.p1  ORF type:complete len:724 (+),score=109.83 Phypoly_transcript_03526:179-2350(+)